jgi:hypothetical protein
MSEQLDRIEKQLEKIYTTLHGNGEPGLKTTVAEHTQSLAVIRRIIWGIGTAVGTLITSYAVAQLF